MTPAAIARRLVPQRRSLMLFFSWRRRRSVRKHRTFRPELEALEARDVLSFGSPNFVTNSIFRNHSPVAQAVKDVNHDNIPDLITITNQGVVGVEVMLGTGNGQFGKPTVFSATGGTDYPT